MSAGKAALKYLNASISKAKSSVNTYKASKQSFRSATGETMSRDLFQKAMKRRLFNEGQTVATAEKISASVAADLKPGYLKDLKKARTKVGKAVQSEIIGFRRIHGKVIPIKGNK